MNRKFLKSIVMFLTVFAALTALSGCDVLGSIFAQYTIKVDTYVDAWVWIQYRESGTTEWIDADLYDEDGSTVPFITYGDSDYPDEAYFDVPGEGTYDFRGIDILGYIEGDGIIENCVVEYSNQMMDDIYGHDLTISYTESIHGFY